MGAFLEKKEVPIRRLVIGILITTAGLCGCHEGDAPTEPRLVIPTPTPVPVVQLAGTWNGRMGTAGETFTATVTQNGTAVTAVWTLSSGAVRFDGNVHQGDIHGRLAFEHQSPLCPMDGVDFSGTATASSISVSASGLCKNWDLFHVSFTLTR